MTILTKEQWEASVAETWSASIKATYQHLIDEAVKAEREACAKVCDDHFGWTPRMIGETIRARSYANDTSSKRVDITEEHKHD
jgi:hypothetical protein